MVFWLSGSGSSLREDQGAELVRPAAVMVKPRGGEVPSMGELGRDVAIWMHSMIENAKLGTGHVSESYPSLGSFCFVGPLLVTAEQAQAGIRRFDGKCWVITCILIYM